MKRRVRNRDIWKIYAVDACLILLAMTTAGKMRAGSPRGIIRVKTSTVATSGSNTVEAGTNGDGEKNLPWGGIEAKEVAQYSPGEDDKETKLPIDEEGKEVLLRIAMAEAEGESLEGKALVMNVVLNRVDSVEFPDTITEVVFQQGQFTPVKNGRYDSVNPDEDCQKAYEMVIHGWDESQGAMYFASTDFPHEWHENNLEWLFTVGKHDFYK